MRSFILFGLFIFFLVIVQFAQAKTVDEIIDKYILARGGKDKLLAINSIFMQGVEEIAGHSRMVSIIKEQGKLYRTEFSAAGERDYTLVTETDGWYFSSLQSEQPTKMTDAAVAQMQPELDITGPLVDYAEKGFKAELLGKDNSEGTPAYKIRVVFADGSESYHFIDTVSYLLVKSNFVNTPGSNTAGQQKAAETTVFYYDYKHVDGILFPHNIEIKNSHGQRYQTGGITFDKIELNLPVDPALYKPQ